MKKIKKMKERILSLALTFLMVVSLCFGTDLGVVDVMATNYSNQTWKITTDADGVIQSVTFEFRTSDTAAGTWYFYLWDKNDTSGTNGRPAILAEKSMTTSNGTHSMTIDYQGERGKSYLIGMVLRDSSWSTGNTGGSNYADWPYLTSVCDMVDCDDSQMAGSVYVNGQPVSGSVSDSLKTEAAPVESFSATLTYEVVGGSGTMAPVEFTAQESVTLPDPNTIFTPASNREFFGWMVRGEDGDVKVSAYNNAQFTVENGESYTATAYYGYRVNVVNLPEGASVVSGSTEFVGNPNLVVVPEFQGKGGLEEGNLFAIMSNSMTSAPTLDVVNATAVSVGSGDGQYVYILQDITGPVTVTLSAATQPNPPAGNRVDITTLEVGDLIEVGTTLYSDERFYLYVDDYTSYLYEMSDENEQYEIICENLGITDFGNYASIEGNEVTLTDSIAATTGTGNITTSNTWLIYLVGDATYYLVSPDHLGGSNSALQFEKESYTVAKGGTVSLVADFIEGTAPAGDYEVEYSLGGSYMPGTSIDPATGMLTVAADETAESILVQAQVYKGALYVTNTNVRVTEGGGTEDTHTHSLTEVPAVPATCTTDGNNKYYTCDCGKVFKADGTTETSVEAETIPAGHVWSTEKDERGHWNVCSACGATDVDIEELEQVPHMDADLNNKCDVCDYVVYHVTLNANGLTVGGASVRDTDGYRVSRFSDGETFLVPELCTVEVICYTEINDAIAPGATVEFVAGEGIANTGCKVYNFTCDTAIVLNPNPGEVEVEETVNPEAPIQGVEIKNEIDEIIEASKIFTTVEVGRILAGEDARVWLDVNKIDTVPTVEAEAIEDKVAELGANAEITYFDASFFKQVGNDAAQTVSEPGMDIEITIAIPEDLLNSDTTKTRTYQLLRYHDVAEGEDVTVINGTFSNGEFTFTTDKFSTYAIIYTDRAVNPGVTPPPSGTNTPNTNAGNNVKDEVPNTGDNNVLSYSFILMVLSAVAFFFSTQKKKSYK